MTPSLAILVEQKGKKRGAGGVELAAIGLSVLLELWSYNILVIKSYQIPDCRYLAVGRMMIVAMIGIKNNCPIIM
jgi:hypothetical protein